MTPRIRWFLVLSTLFILIMTSSGFAQKDAPKARSLKRVEIERRAAELGIPLTMSNETSTVLLQGFTEKGMPLYFTTNNSVSAATVSSDRVYPGGSAGLFLTGAGVVLGEWDAGGVRTTHQELAGRVTQMDSPVSLHNHSTHVAGTLIASGVQASARGMSYTATLQAYDWDDDNTEMATAAANGLKVSNHSYGFITGWYSSGGVWYWFGDVAVSTTEDANFGYYSIESLDWDNITVSNPNYLIVKSAGNDRGQGPASGTGHYYWNTAIDNWSWSTAVRDKDGGAMGYDCVTDRGTSKNILTIGAIDDIPGGYVNPAGVVMSSFSSWGPTDDGRIKPDIVTNGIGLYSSLSTSNNSYASSSGTSMAGPSAAGSIGLLLEHQNNLHPGTPLKASTMKALIIHTANESGTTAGPDYAFGWGLMNTTSAAQVMTDDVAPGSPGHIEEHILANSATYTRVVKSDGSPLRITVAWTDPATQVLTPALNDRTPRLVNDLDLRVVGPGNTVFYPWRLDPDNPSFPAAQGDNIRDNVEMVSIPAPTNGDLYTVQVTHKGFLANGSQLASIIVTGNIPIVNQLPTADAGLDQTADCVPASGVNVTLDGSGSSDIDGDPLTYTWTEGATVLAGPTSNSSSVVLLSPGVHVITLTVDDGISGTDTDDVAITLNADLTQPSITAPAALVLGNDAGLCGKNIGSISLGTPIVSDNCPGVTYSNNAPAFFPKGLTVVTWTALDANGNQRTATQNVTINDTQAPTISTLSPVIADTDPGICGRNKVNVALGLPSAADNCVTVTITNNAPAVFPVGNTIVTWTATDASANTATSTQLVTINDAQAPTVTAPAPLILDNQAGQCGRAKSLISMGTGTATDNCGVLSLTNNAPNFFPVGTTPVIWTALDAKGNIGTATQNITIRDVEKPTINAPPTVNVNSDANSCGRSTAVMLGTPSASDNCGAVSTWNNAPAVFPVGTTNVIWTAQDQYGNVNTATQQVIVKDVTPPNIMVVLFPQSLFPANRTMRTITASVTVNDNCPGGSFKLTSVTSSEPDAGTGPGDLPNDIVAMTGQATTQFALRAERAPIGFGRTYSVKYTATDGSGNSRVIIRQVYVALGFFKEEDIVFSDEASVPETPKLEQNYPNPFASATSLVFRLPEEKSISLRVYDALGREVAQLAEGLYNPGSYAVIFEANDLPDGAYYARLKYGSQIIQTKMLLVRD